MNEEKNGDVPDLSELLKRQKAWSGKTFGPGKRTVGITEHIKKEIEEIREDPDDLMEWIDVITLAFDRFLRAGGIPESAIRMLHEKQEINFRRKYPYPVSQDLPSEHRK